MNVLAYRGCEIDADLPTTVINRIKTVIDAIIDGGYPVKDLCHLAAMVSCDIQIACYRMASSIHTKAIADTKKLATDIAGGFNTGKERP